MAVTSFKDVNWTGVELVDTDKLNTMAANTRFLFERAPKLYYNSFSVQRDTGTKVACGTAVFGASSAPEQYVNVYFGSFFTPGCKPVITHGVLSSHNRRLIPSMFGLSGAAYTPDHRGFVASLAATELHDRNYITRTVYLNWIAVGY